MANLVTPMPMIRARFFDDNGRPLSGGKIYTYEPNTTTPKTTYKDLAATIPNTNPILLDVAGEADIYFDGQYRVIVESWRGEQLYDVDNIGSPAQIKASFVVDASGKTQQQINDVSVKNGDYAPVLGSPVRLKLNPVMASFIYGISDPTHLDDNLNNFRGLNNPDAYHDSNVAIGAVSFGRNNPPFAYLSFATGHDCVPFGVASVVGGAGSCTGNPDVPTDGANYGYCSLAVGKDTQARGRISNAMGERCLSESMYSSTDGYYAHAGKRLPTHPDYDLYGADGSAGTASRAHGYDVQAFGNFAFAYGALLRAYNGAQLIGRGSTSTGSYLQLSKRGLGLGYNVSKPTIFCKEGDGIDANGAHIGFNTDVPMNRYDFRMRQSDSVSFNMESIEPDTQMALVVNGLKNTLTEYMELFKIGVTHPNSGQPYGVTTFYQNGNPCAQFTEIGDAKFNSWVDAKNGFYVNGTKVIGGQGNAIPNAGTDTNSLQTTINAILGVLRAHGLIAT